MNKLSIPNKTLKHFSQLSASATLVSLLAEDSEFLSADLTAMFGKIKVPYFRVRLY